LADGLCDLGGGIILAEGHHDCETRAVPLLNYTLEFDLQLRKCTENVRTFGRETTRCAEITVFLRTASTGLLSVSPTRLPVGDFSQPLVGISAFQLAEIRASPHQITSIRNSQSVLWCGRGRKASPNPREFACY
jgi:hypothetical protein